MKQGADDWHATARRDGVERLAKQCVCIPVCDPMLLSFRAFFFRWRSCWTVPVMPLSMAECSHTNAAATFMGTGSDDAIDTLTRPAKAWCCYPNLESDEPFPVSTFSFRLVSKTYGCGGATWRPVFRSSAMRRCRCERLGRADSLRRGRRPTRSRERCSLVRSARF